MLRAEPTDQTAGLWEAWPDPILTYQKDQVQGVNSAYHRIFGTELPSTKWVPSQQAQAEYPGSKPFTLDYLLSQGRVEDVLIESPILGSRVFEFSRILDGEKSVAVILLRDRTEKYLIEQGLMRKHLDLRKIAKELESKTAELIATQDLLVQSGKMAALGELAAGIAHELNQPLQGIRGFAQEVRDLALPHLPPGTQHDATAASIREIIINVDKMAKIISTLRGFVRKSTEDLEWVDLKQSVENSVKLMAHQLKGRGIEFKLVTIGSDLKVFANAIQLEQVLINLFSNARDAIDETKRGFGQIKVEILETKKGLIELTVRDDGCGMSQSSLSRAFNPFFTTKEVGKGMGLGLSITYGIIQKLHGSIVIESDEGKGSLFRVLLPRNFREVV